MGQIPLWYWARFAAGLAVWLAVAALAQGLDDDFRPSVPSLEEQLEEQLERKNDPQPQMQPERSHEDDALPPWELVDV